MRKNITVTYELNIINKEGEEMVEVFSHVFDSELYNEDVEGIDVMMVNFKVQDLQKRYGQVFLMEFSIERDSTVLN